MPEIRWRWFWDPEVMFEHFIPATGQDEDRCEEMIFDRLKASLDLPLTVPMPHDAAMLLVRAAFVAASNALVDEGVLVPLRRKRTEDVAPMVMGIDDITSYQSSRMLAMKASMGVSLTDDEVTRLGPALDVLEEARRRDPVEAIMKRIKANVPPEEKVT